MMFALVASALWIVNSVYSIGYMRANNEPRQTVYYVCFAIALGSTIGVAFAKNLFTLFLFYETLTLSTYPLVAHSRTAEAMRSGRLYLALLLGTSICSSCRRSSRPGRWPGRSTSRPAARWPERRAPR